jgi:GLPGLI family protein
MNFKGSTFFLIILFVIPTMLLAQTDSIPFGRVIYLQNVQTQGDFNNNGYSTLLFNNAQSIYIQNGAQKNDTTINNPDYYLPVNISGDKEGFPILKLHNARKIYCKIDCRQAKEDCILSDTFGTTAWELLPERKQFSTYECRKAKGAFRGRIYEVWYTLDIPIPSGPFKLGGLPGLILEAQSTDGQVKFLFSQLEISNRIPGFIVMPHGKNMGMSYKKFIQGELEFCAKLEKEGRAQGIETTVTREVFIELDTNN